MTDPLSSVGAGQVSPLVTQAATVNAVLEAARDFRQFKRGMVGGGHARRAVPSTLEVLVKNSTDTTLPIRSVVGLGTPAISAVDQPIRFLKDPVFASASPTPGDPFVILAEPIGGGKIGRAVIQGVTPVDLSVSDSTHEFAVPASGVTSRLASAKGGGAQILWKESGTGTKRAVILMAGTDSLVWDQTSSLATHDISADGTDEDFGSTLTVPEAGNYWVWIMFNGLANASALAAETYISGQLSLNGVVQGPPVYLEGFVTAVVANRNHHNASLAGGKLSLSAGNTLRLSSRRTAGPTWTTAFVSGFLGYMRLS